ncbi:MAG TPA: DUF5372 family protein [Actinomycetota bacterium]|nr:DUF5372 family protein [Actinomycetota bacterium]
MGSGCRPGQPRRPVTAKSTRSQTTSDCVVVTHPFHPLSGQRLEVTSRERRGGVACLRCLAGPMGSVVVPVAWTDRAEPPAVTRLTYEGLVDLARAVTALQRLAH